MCDMEASRPTIVLDLDGTLIDTAQRHYALYTTLGKRFSVDVLPFEDYWNLRRTGLSNIEVLRQGGLQVADSGTADAMWRRDIESPSLLQMDRVLPGVVDWLHEWSCTVHFALITVRSHTDFVNEQLKRMDLIRHLAKVVVVGHGPSMGNIKAAAARGHVTRHPVAWVGDTEVDIAAARELGAHPIGVTTGIRTAERLRVAGAEQILDSVTAIKAWPIIASPAHQ